MAGTKRRNRDLTGIRQRGGAYQVRIFGGSDPVTGKQVVLTGSADSEDAAVKLRDTLRQQVRDRTAARTNATLGHLLDEWLSSHQVEETTRGSYSLLIENFIRPAFGDTTLAKLTQLGRARSSSSTWTFVSAAGVVTAHPASSIARRDRTSVTSDAEHMNASRWRPPPSGNAMRSCEAP